MQCTNTTSNLNTTLTFSYKPLIPSPNYQTKKCTNLVTSESINSLKITISNTKSNSNNNNNTNITTVTSTSNPFVKHCVKLRQNASYRHSHGSVLLVGTTLIREIHEFHNIKQEQQMAVECLFVLDKAEFPEGLSDIPGERVYVNSLVMKKLSGVRSTESIEAIALMKMPQSFVNLNESYNEIEFIRWFRSIGAHRILVLEGIQDPGNLGTLLRSALAFKWNGVFLLPGCCDPFNEKALRASRGAPFQLPLVSGTWAHLEAFSNAVQVKMLAGHPDSSDGFKPVHKLSQSLAHSLDDKPLCLVLGSEGSGLTGKAMQFCELVCIPMANNFESLNVSVAGGIFMFMLQSELDNL